jgi:hypothetical protein
LSVELKGGTDYFDRRGCGKEVLDLDMLVIVEVAWAGIVQEGTKG